MTKHSTMQTKLEKALARLNKHNPAAYEQLKLLPFGVIPSYAYDDKKCAWWVSQEAKDRLFDIQEAILDGPK